MSEKRPYRIVITKTVTETVYGMGGHSTGETARKFTLFDTEREKINLLDIVRAVFSIGPGQYGARMDQLEKVYHELAGARDTMRCQMDEMRHRCEDLEE